MTSLPRGSLAWVTLRTGQSLLELRRALGATQERLAQILGVHPRTIQRNEKRSRLSLYLYRRLRASKRLRAFWRGYRRSLWEQRHRQIGLTLAR